MEFKIIAPGSNEIQLTNSLPASFNGLILPGAETIAAMSEFGKMIFQQFKGEGFDIWFSNYNFSHSTQLIGRADIPFFELHIQLSTQFHNDWDGYAKALLRPYQYNLTYAPHVNNKVEFVAG